MSEQHPLLYDEVSEEEQFSPRFHRRLLMSRARARNQVKGAAAIITRWPEQWTSLLNCWWIGISMIALTTFLVYNFLFSYAMLQPEYKPHPKHPAAYLKNTSPLNGIPKPSSSPTVFMHLFVDDKQEVDLNRYLPYIEIIANKYKHFKYELIVVANDTNVETKYLDDKEKNELALNMLWKDDLKSNKLIQGKGNLDVEYVTLSQYLQNSPLQKYWKILPYQFMRLLVRAVSVWDKGGIAFDPIVLTPQSPHSNYIDKINDILRMYKTNKEKGKTPSESFKLKIKPDKKLNKLKPKLNNIRDIINQLENENTSGKLDLEPLAVAETKYNFSVTNGRKIRYVNDTHININNGTKHITVKEVDDVTSNSQENLKDASNKGTTKENLIENAPKLNLLPMFLEYLFHKSTKNLSETAIIADSEGNRPTDVSKIKENKSLKMRHFWSEITDKKNYKPMIVSAKAILNKPDNETKVPDLIEKEVEKLFEVTIDLKGNIIAADTPCHAFIGDMFINAIHHDQSESVTDFIIHELSVFCKGLLASCIGIDVILM